MARFALLDISPRREAFNIMLSNLQRWREAFAEKLREWGIDAEATRQATRGRSQNYEPLWRIKAREDVRLRSDGAASSTKSSARARTTRATETTNGWYVWGGEMSDADDFFSPLHVEHMESQLPLALKYLDLPPGYRFQIDGSGHEDIWFDARLLDHA